VFDVPSDTVVIYNLSKLPLELSSAIRLWQAFYEDNTDNRHTIRELENWLSKNIGGLDQTKKKRIATIVNPFKQGGAPKTP
jgi:hypothetical protein